MFRGELLVSIVVFLVLNVSLGSTTFCNLKTYLMKKYQHNNVYFIHRKVNFMNHFTLLSFCLIHI